MNKQTTPLILGAVAILIAVVGFVAFGGGDDDDAASTEPAQTVQRSDEFPLDFSVNNLEPLSEGIYEGWIVRGDDKFTFGTFNTTESGAIDGNLSLDGVEPQDGDMVVVTIEPVPDDDPEPSGVIILAGALENGSAELAFPIDVNEFGGQYILATPTNGDGTNETSGIWFVDPSDLSASLNIPDAPDGWVYEGWVVHQGQPITSGKFTSAEGFDLFDGFSGPEDGPPFPGEDYLENLPSPFTDPLELADGETMIVVSIEPDINGTDPTGDGPAQVKPLSAAIPAGAADHFLYDLSTSDESVPSGSASL